MSDLMATVHAHPYLGGLATLLLTVFGYTVEKINLLFSLELPLWIMQWLQAGAWIGAILVAAITVHNWYKKNFKS